MSVAELVPGFVRSGKVRDIFALDDARLLLVASDRISAFDVVLPTPIPDKGRVLTGLSRYWFRETERAGIMPNHLLSTSPDDLPETYSDAADDLRGRSMICRRAEVLPVELIVRGYITGSGWKDYLRTGAVCGIPLADGLRESDRLPEPLFTPSTKAEEGHDQNISFDEMVRLVGPEVAERARDAALALYSFAAARAESAGIIVADTKFEFGLLPTGEMILIDEVLTPDSSRFWEMAAYEPGRGQASYDKQFVRDYLETLDWDKTYPGPELPADVVAGTQQRYAEAFERITGGSFATYLAEDRLAGDAGGNA
jgi:phosphoribosylaminoimidazole-succinocarboxamide synthase